MEREEQIRSKAKELGQKYFPDEANIWARGNIEAEYVENACVEMAEWLDQHPNWIPVEKELPDEDMRVLTIDKDGYKEIMDFEFGRWSINHWPPITHWMPLPQPPRKEE